jgi:hypothetical protein
MQYPVGTTFTASKSKLVATTFRGKLLFKDGVYSILNIRKKDAIIEYEFNYNNMHRVTLQIGSCRDMDRIIAFCRNEIYFEPTIKDEFSDA